MFFHILTDKQTQQRSQIPNTDLTVIHNGSQQLSLPETQKMVRSNNQRSPISELTSQHNNETMNEMLSQSLEPYLSMNSTQIFESQTHDFDIPFVDIYSKGIG